MIAKGPCESLTKQNIDSVLNKDWYYCFRRNSFKCACLSDIQALAYSKSVIFLNFSCASASKLYHEGMIILIFKVHFILEENLVNLI